MLKKALTFLIAAFTLVCFSQGHIRAAVKELEGLRMVTGTTDSIQISWLPYTDTKVYKVYVSDPATGSYSLAKTVKQSKAVIKKLTPGTAYNFKVEAVGKKVLASGEITGLETPVPIPEFTVAESESSIKIKWNDMGVDGYIIRWDDGTGAFKNKKVLKGSRKSCVIKNTSLSKKYGFKMQAFKNGPEGRITSGISDPKFTGNPESRFNAAVKRESAPYYYTRSVGSSEISKVTIPEEEWNIVKRFAKKHFTDDMTDYEKAEFTYDYIVTHTAYDKPYETPGGYATKVLVNHHGQCDGYNGAFAMVMAYLGYDTVFVRGSGHHWLEFTAGGHTYAIDPNLDFYTDPVTPDRDYFIRIYKPGDYSSFGFRGQ